MHKSTKSGFTLLELLIVVGIIATLSVATVVVINPSEALKKSRDTQRISDLNVLKKAIAIYSTSTPHPKLAGIDNTGCKGTAFGSTWQLDSDHIYYSYPSDAPGAPITGKSLDGVTFTTGGAYQVTKANLAKNDGTGWLPVDFTSLAGGSPISALPVDPVNTIADPANPKSTDLVYRYICSEQNLTYELDATLESTAYTVTDNKMAKDGGNNDSYYEAGTGLALMNEESPSVLACGAYTVVGPDTLTYGTVVGADGRCWLDRNLGATRVATAYNDTQAYGHLYQWGRGVDGHQIRTSGTTTTLSSTDTPGHGNFITSSLSPWDWRSPQNSSLWQGVNGINNPCPTGFRVPTGGTGGEWKVFTDAAGITGLGSGVREAFANSSLKIPTSGARDFGSAALTGAGFTGYYWSSRPDISSNGASDLLFNAVSVYPEANTPYRGYGFVVRCIKD